MSDAEYKTNFDKYKDLYLEAKSEKDKLDARIERRLAIYYGTTETLDFTNPNNRGGFSKEPVHPFRKIVFEMIESQVDTSIPLAKVTPFYVEDMFLAASTEEYLNLAIESKGMYDKNDITERESRLHGAVIYQVDWDERAGSSRRQGDFVINVIRFKDFIPQPYIEHEDNLEYAFVKSTTTVRAIKELYGKDVPPDNGTKTSVNLITCWYLNDKGEVSKMVWTEQLEELLIDIDNYYSRKQKVCRECGQPWNSGEKQCEICGSKKSKFIDLPDTFEVPEDLYLFNTDKPNAPSEIYLKKGELVKSYRIKKLPFVIQRNITDPKGGLFGISDADLLEAVQDADNKLVNKMVENVMNGGSIVTIPANTTIENRAKTLKVVRVHDVRQKNLIDVHPIQANSQQDDIMNSRMYEFARQTVGITDSFQGKRDTTAESGKAKEISAMQTAGRLESKYINKLSAYGRLYRKIFEFLLAFSDEPRRIVQPYSNSGVQEATFSKYSFIVKDEVGNNHFLNDDFIFATNGSYALSNKKESLWNSTTQAFMAGTFGNPADPMTIRLYWQLMARYDYPLASKVLQQLEALPTNIPQEILQALSQNPELINELGVMLEAKAQNAQEEAKGNVEATKNALKPKAQKKEENKGPIGPDDAVKEG